MMDAEVKGMRLITAEQVARIMNVSVHRVYRLVRLGLLPGVRLGRQVRFDEDALREFIESGGRSLDDEQSSTERRSP